MDESELPEGLLSFGFVRISSEQRHDLGMPKMKRLGASQHRRCQLAVSPPNLRSRFAKSMIA